MKLTFRDAQLAIFDDVLSAERFASLWQLLKTLEYERVHQNRIHGVWRVMDGNPARGQEVVWLGLAPEEFGGLEALRRSGHAVFPTGGPIDAPFEALSSVLPGLEDLVGHQGSDWYAVKGRPWLYPAGTRLSWHDDDEVYTGSFIFYAHPLWSALWGGELLVANEGVRARRRAASEPLPAGSRGASDFLRQDDEGENRELMQEGLGRYVLPKPNRLVILAGGVSHMITEVSAAAGSNVRTSVGGFFLRRPREAKEMLELVFGPNPA